ncbi:high mobility group protein B2 [Periplaneta americana]|uniref:high mobility group protein B2 n=1 Tax=Periplaneta americana TaxID=6978 RepID=UPI0037E762F8
MSEHHRGAWGAREDAVWWPGAIATSDYQQSLQSHHQHLLNQHHQQQLAAQQHQQQQQQAQQQASQHDAVARSTAAAAATQQLFSYKMASSFQNPATTMTSATVSSSSPVASCMRGYDYSSGGMVGAGGRSGDAGSAPQWWYPSGMANSIQNVPSPPAVPQQQNRGRMPRGKADAKPRGRMTAYAFFVQTCREEHKKKHPDENVIFAEFSKKCAERWKTMLDKEKKRFHEMAEKDKKRYDTEMEGYTPPKGEKTRGKKRKHVKDPNAPKRSLSAFFWFCNDERSKVKALNPEFGVGDIAKELGRRWSGVDPELKSKYEAMAEKDKARYDREMTAYKKRPKGGTQVAQAPLSKKQESEDEDEEEEEDGDEEDE